MTLSEKISYIRGLADGLELDNDKKEVKVLNAIIDLLDDMTLAVEDMEDLYDELAEQVDAIDEDLTSIEDDFYDDCDCCDCDDCDDDCDCDCDCDFECEDCDCDCDCDCDDCVEELECPACGEMIYIDSEEIEHMEKVICPSCNAELDVVCNDEECDCCCGDEDCE